MKVFIVISLMIIGPVTQASLPELAQVFLKNNLNVQVAKSDYELVKLDLEKFNLQKNINLNFSSAYTDNSLESFSAFAAQFAGGAFRLPVRSIEHSVGLGKNFTWGGELKLEHTYSNFDAIGAQDIYGFSQGLTYTQDLGRDFFGRGFKDEQKEMELNVSSGQGQSEKKIYEELLSFINNYYQVALDKALVKLQDESKQRAQRRLGLIRKRVRDGLREKVDQIQAQISLYKSIENVASAKQNMKSSMEKISLNVHRKVAQKEIHALRGEGALNKKLPEGNVKNNITLKSLDSEVKATASGLSAADLSILPDIKFEAGVRSNNFDPRTSRAFSSGLIGNDNQELRLALNVIWPLGSKPQKVEKTRALIIHKTAKLKHEKLSRDLVQNESSLKDRIEILHNNILSATKRLGLAKSALREYSNLYERGRADLDQLIEAEETLINTEVSYVRYIAEKEQLVYRLAYLYGNLKKYTFSKEGK